MSHEHQATPDFYQHLLAQTQAERATLFGLPIIQAALAGQVSRTQYIAFLEQAYHHVKHTLPLLMACGSRLPECHEPLRRAMTHYIEEEVGHQDWILADIAQAGGDPDKVRECLPALDTRIMVAYAYDLIHRRNPCAFLGMVFVLEGTSIQLATRAAHTLKNSLNLPDSAFTYLTSHGALDIDHMAFFAQVVNQYLRPEDQLDVTQEARVFYHLYSNIFRCLPRN